MLILLTLSARLTKTNTYANSVDLDETDHHEPPYPDLHSLLFAYRVYFTDIPICSNGRVKIQRWLSPLQKLGDERVICFGSLGVLS